MCGEREGEIEGEGWSLCDVVRGESGRAVVYGGEGGGTRTRKLYFTRTVV